MSCRMLARGIRTAFLSIATLAGVALAAPAHAALISFSAFLDGLQEAPPNAVPGTGSAAIAYDTVSHVLSWSLSYSDLIAGVTAAHFHGNSTFGVSSPARVDVVANSAPAMTGTTSGSVTGSYDLDDGLLGGMSLGDAETGLFGGLWYINIHTSFDLAGEIRGQVIADVPEPAGLAVLGLALAGIGFLRRRR